MGGTVEPKCRGEYEELGEYLASLNNFTGTQLLGGRKFAARL